MREGVSTVSSSVADSSAAAVFTVSLLQHDAQAGLIVAVEVARGVLRGCCSRFVVW